MRRSLSAQLLVSATLALVAAIALIFGAEAALSHYLPEWLTHHSLAGTSDDIIEGLRFDVSGKPVAVDLKPARQQMFDVLPLDVLYRVVDRDGNVLLSSEGARDALAPDGGAFDASRSSFDRIRGGAVLHVLTVPVERAGLRSYVQVARSERFNDAMQRNNRARGRLAALAAAVVAMLVFGAVVLYTVHRMLQRLTRVSDAASRIAPRDLTARLDTADVPSEVTPLIESFNSSLERLELGYRLQKEFLATAAHELRTPLALMRAQVELDGSPGGAALLKDIDHMARQVHQLLYLAEVSEVQNYSVETLDVMTIVMAADDQLARLSEAREVTVRIEGPGRGVMLAADPGALTVLVRNLVENAVHHSAPGSIVLVKVDQLGIRVRDYGRGIDPADMPMLFKRFWRGAHRRDEGAGLGLSICHEIAQFHGWSLTARNAEMGAEFALVFDAQAQPRPRLDGSAAPRPSPEPRTFTGMQTDATR
jgi:two-component system sensor histidine kinase QseC